MASILSEVDKYVLVCPACGYQRKLKKKDIKYKRGKPVVKTTCPKCGSNMAVIKLP